MATSWQTDVVIAAADFFLFDDQLLAWLLLAFGAAMVVGNLAAVFRPPPPDPDGLPVERPSMSRIAALVAIGLLATIWAVSSLVARN